MFGSGKHVGEGNSNDLEWIIKIEPVRFEDDCDLSKTDEIQCKQYLWPRVVVTDVLLPTVTLNRISSAKVVNLTAYQPNSSDRKTFLKYKCHVCNEAFVYRVERSRHILKVHYEGEKFECECGKLHRHRSAFYSCRSSHRSSGFSCKVCKSKFTSRIAILGHWKRMHFKQLGHLQLDNLICLKNEGDFTCDVCGKVLKGRRAILRHLTYQHFNPDLSCDLCPKTYKRIGDLRIHMNHLHLMVKPYHCNICAYKTAFQSNLRDHKQTHQVPKPIACKICKKGMRKRSLLNHMKIFHGRR